ncbi:MAG: hypothetical protein PHP10_03310 [Candidatus Omnitrophica bacterium]|nr:hypothetical protein [Candidatus Omnitrophota bacterium]
MGWQRFLSLISATIGLIGAIFLAKSFLALTPKEILYLTSPYSRMAFAPEQIASMSAQKADAIIGVFFILLAFTGQIFTLVFLNEVTPFVNSRWIGFWIAIVCTSVLTLIFSFIDLKIAKHIRLETGKIAVREYCERSLNCEKVDPVNLKSLGIMAHDLLDMTKKVDENTPGFYKRIFEYISWNYSDSTDFLKKASNLN